MNFKLPQIIALFVCLSVKLPEAEAQAEFHPPSKRALTLKQFPELESRYALNARLSPTGKEITYLSGGGAVGVYALMLNDARKMVEQKLKAKSILYDQSVLIKPKVLIMAVASKKNAAINAQATIDALKPFSHDWVGTILDKPKDEVELLDHLEKIYSADLIIWTGGSQDRIYDYVASSPYLVQAIRGGYSEGRYINAGSSAGAAIQSVIMVDGYMPDDGEPALKGDRVNAPLLKVARGLGFLPPDVLVDTHYFEMNRDKRLAPYMKKNRLKMAIGLESNGGSIRVTGMNQVEVVGLKANRFINSYNSDREKNPQIYKIFQGDQVNLKTRQTYVPSKNVSLHGQEICPIVLEGYVSASPSWELLPEGK